MRETMLHFTHAINDEDRRKLCSALETRGGNCNIGIRSTKPHLLFVAYDENRIVPRDLVQIAAEAGHRVQLVDL